MLPFFKRDEFPLSDEELADRRRKRRRLTAVLSITIGMLVIGCFLARPTFNAVRGWQARRHAEKAFQLIDQQKWTGAQREASAAYQLQSNEPDAIRAMARLLSRAGQPQAMGFWRELEKHSKPTASDLRDEATVALKTKDLATAEEVVRQLLNRPGFQASDQVLAAQVALQKQDFDGANKQINAVLGNSAVSDRDRLQATVLLWDLHRARDVKDQTDVFDRLAKLARGTTDVSLDALIALAQAFLNSSSPWPNPDGMTIDDLSRTIENHPLAKPQHKLVAVDLKIRIQPDAREQIIRDAVAQLKSGDDATLSTLAGWLNSHGENQLELDAISAERAIQSRELFFQHVDALSTLGRWDEIKKLIESEQFPLDPMVEHMYLARCFAQKGQTAGAENNWHRALEDAAGDASKLVTLGDYAERNGVLDVAGAAYDAAVAISPKLRVAQHGRLRVAYARRDTRRVQGVLGELLKVWPNDSAVQNDEAYARLLMTPELSRLNGQSSPSPQLSTIERFAESLVEREPASLPHRTLLALARLKQNRPYDALSAYRGISVTAKALTNSALCVHVAILAATNETEEAKREAATLPLDKVLPEERALVEQAIGSKG